MKAITFRQYGGPEVLKLEEVEKPTPKDSEVLIKIHAAGMNAADWHIMRADPFIARFAMGLFKPNNEILGLDVSGVVESVGKNVQEFKPGDEVFADLFGDGLGAYAEYTCAKESNLVLKPKNLSFEEAAIVPLSACTALQALRKGNIKSGQKVLINGASGGVGIYVLQIAKSFGAEVTAVCSTKNIEQAKSLGSDYVIDYTKEDFTKNGKQYDLIIGVNGYKTLSEYKSSLAPKGSYVMIGGGGKQMFEAMAYGPFMSLFGNKKLTGVSAKSNKKDLTFIKELIETGKVKPIIDKTYKLEELPEAMKYLEEGHAKGKIVIKINK